MLSIIYNIILTKKACIVEVLHNFSQDSEEDEDGEVKGKISTTRSARTIILCE